MTTLNTSTTEQLNKLIEFRQILYEQVLSQGRDAQFETIDSLLCSDHPRSFAELSLSPMFRRQWPSLYDGLERGRQNRRQLDQLLVQQVPRAGVQVFVLDTTVWPHPSARTLPDLVYAPSPTRALKQRSIVKGHIYSLLSWSPQAGSSWSPVVHSQRVKADQTAIEIGVEQVRQLCQQRFGPGLTVITADGHYGNHHFLAPLKRVNCATVCRLRCDRVLYGPPGPYSGRGRPRKHGHRFAFKEPTSWPTPDERVEFEHADWGQVHLRCWYNFHAKQDANTSFHVIQAQVHQERVKPPAPLWLAYAPAPEQAPYPVREVWSWFTQRWPIEPAIRFRKQHLAWTLPRFQSEQTCDRWTRLVDLAYWQLFLARTLVQDQPLPWQKAQTDLTPARVQRGLGALFGQFDSLAQPPKTRRNSPGWPKGRPRTRPVRYKPIKRGQSRASPA